VYAIVDIETTGGHASSNGITEIAIILHNGVEEEGRYETLLNPGMALPRYITALTGITNKMLIRAPRFEDVAHQVYNLLQGRIFVAHNVNFDYSFIRHHLSACGYDLHQRKLCTVRMSRKIFPGLRGYSLGKLCLAFSIPNEQRHRAMGDAQATARLFSTLLANDHAGIVSQMLKAGSRESYLPMHLDAAAIDQLPLTPGVYYFHNNKDKVIYVGKAVNLRKRVTSHFSNNAPSRRKQELIQQVHRISFEECGSDFTASLLESLEIRRRWPAFNSSQKRVEVRYGLYGYEDQRGILRLAIERKRRGHQPLYSFSMLTEGHALLRRLVDTYRLCPRFCCLQTSEDRCPGSALAKCAGICDGREPILTYNERVREATGSLGKDLPSFVIREKGRTGQEQCVALMDRGVFYGYGFLEANQPLPEKDSLKDMLTPCTDNDYIRSLMIRHANLYPEKMHTF
jgi:DNA polymerase III subunit epsilon